MSNLKGEIILGGVLIVLLVLFLNPFEIWMPDMATMTMMAMLLVVFGVFAVFVTKEKVRDEREEIHRMRAGRIAFLSGATVLVLGIIYQSFKHTLDPVLVVALAVMVVAKIVTLVYSREKS